MTVSAGSVSAPSSAAHRDVYAWLRDALTAAHHAAPLPAIITG